MRRATVQTMQRLALCAGLCCLGWIVFEAVDHDAAWANDVVPAVAAWGGSPAGTTPTSDEQPGGLLDLVGDATEPVGEVVNDVLPGDSDDDPGRGGDEPDDEEEPVREVIEEIADAVTPQTPEPAEGDADGRPQHPVGDTPPAPDPTPDLPAVPEPPATPVIETPVAVPPIELPDTALPVASADVDHPPFGGALIPAPWTSDLDAHRAPGPTCDSRDDPGASAHGRPGASTRDRADVPRHLPGPGVVPLGAPCDPGQPVVGDHQAPATAPNPPDQPHLTTAARDYYLGLDVDPADRTRRDDTTPVGRLTLWPPGPG